MFAILIVLFGVFAAGGVFGALATVAAGIRAEQRTCRFGGAPPTVTAARRAMGVYVRRAAEDDATDDTGR